MTEWKVATIDQVASTVTKGTTPTSLGYEFHATGIPFVKVESITPGGIINQKKLAYISEDAHEHLKRSQLKVDDVLFTIAGTIGRVARVLPSDIPANTNQAVAIVRPDSTKVSPRFVLYCLRDEQRIMRAQSRVVQSVQANLSLSELKSVEIPLPSLDEQRAIVSVLGALDDKIAVNERIAATARELGMTLFFQAVQGGDLIEVEVGSIATSLTRGVAPKYSESPDELLVLNQKCIRDGRVNLSPARRTLGSKVATPKLLQHNDILINSTGVGTLGRVARWTSNIKATVDSHITIVRFDAQQVDPVCAGFAILRAQPEIEAMGEGSTGQTELRRTQVGGLEFSLPSPARQRELRIKLDSLEERADQALAESRTLAGLRDTLLPQLMSGRLRVRDAEKMIEDQV